MNVLDYIAFKKMGLSADDIKACINNGIKPDELKGLNEPDNAAATDVVDNAAAAAPAPETAPAADPVVPASNDPDYKALYEAEKAKLSKIQSDNTRQPVADKPITADDIVNAISAKM